MAAYLELGLVNADSSVMRLLPPEIAYRYHALPVATDGIQITVAMAEPDDPQASQAIQAVIDRPLCLIHADPGLIDSQLHHLWPSNAPHTRLLTWFTERTAPLELFSSCLADQLEAVLESFIMPAGQPDPVKALGSALSDHQPDLLVFHDRQPLKMIRQLLKTTGPTKGSGLASFLVLPARPLWPIKTILFILPDSKIESDLAVTWTEKLASSTNGKVTILPLLPSVPQMYGSFLNHNLDSLLAGNDRMGVKLRQIANRFTDLNIEGVYKLRDGDPLNQIREEIVTSQPELIIIPSCLRPGCSKWLNADFSGRLFEELNTPILLTSENQTRRG